MGTDTKKYGNCYQKVWELLHITQYKNPVLFREQGF